MTYKKFIFVMNMVFLAAAIAFIAVLVGYGFTIRRDLAKEAIDLYNNPVMASFEIYEQVYVGVYNDDTDRWTVECEGYTSTENSEEISDIFDELVNEVSQMLIIKYRKLLTVNYEIIPDKIKIVAEITYQSGREEYEVFWGNNGLYLFDLNTSPVPDAKFCTMNSDTLDLAKQLGDLFVSESADSMVTVPDTFEMYDGDELHISAELNEDNTSYSMIYPIEAKYYYNIFFEDIKNKMMLDVMMKLDEEPKYRFIYTQGGNTVTYNVICIGDGTIWDEEGVFVSVDSSEIYYKLDVSEYSDIYQIITISGYYPTISIMEFSNTDGEIAIEKRGYSDDFEHTLQYIRTEQSEKYIFDNIDYIEEDDADISAQMLFYSFEDIYNSIKDIGQYAAFEDYYEFYYKIETDEVKLSNAFKGYIITYNKDTDDEISIKLLAGRQLEEDEYYVFINDEFVHLIYCAKLDFEELSSRIDGYNLNNPSD